MPVTRTRRSPLRIAALWAPPLLLMAVIYVLSAQPDLSSGLGTFDFILRKLVHMAEYALLLFLWWRALSDVTPMRAALALAFTITVLYSASDEWHQSYVNGRHGTPIDVGIDMVGMLVAAVLVLRTRQR